MCLLSVGKGNQDSMTTDEREQAQNYARELYLELDTDGNRKYSYADIAIKIQEKCNISVDQSTISRWAQADRWETLLQIAKNTGVQKALKEKQTREENIKEAKANEIADLYKVNMAFFRATSNIISKALADQTIEFKDVMALFARCGENVMRLNDVMKGSNDDRIGELMARMHEMIELDNEQTTV